MLLELSTFRKCFAWFRSGNSDLKGQNHFGRPAVVNDDQIANNPGYMSRDIGEILYISDMNVVRHLIGEMHLISE